MILDFRPPSVTESSEATLRRLLASRAIGGNSLTSDGLALGTPRYAELFDHVSLLSSSVCSYLDAYKQRMLRPVSGLLTWKNDWDRPVVTLILFSGTALRHFVGFVRDLVKAGSVWFVEAAVEHVGKDCYTLAGSADSPLVVYTIAARKHGLGSLGFRWSYADNFGGLVRGANCTNFHLARLIAGVQKARLDIHDISLARRSADVLCCEVSPANSCFSGTGKRIARIRSVARARTVSSRRRISSRAMELVNRHESFLALSNRGALSILDASFKFARASYLVSGEPWSTVRMEQSTYGGILCLLRSVGVFGGLMSASVRMHWTRASRSRFVKNVASWLRRWVVSQSGQGSREVPDRARSRALLSFAPDVVLECSSSDEDEVSLARRESRVDFPEVSLQLLDP